MKRFICERQTRHAYVSAMAAERGIPGLLAVLWLIGKALVDFIRQLRRSRAPPEAHFVFHLSIAVILAQGLFEYNLGDS